MQFKAVLAAVFSTASLVVVPAQAADIDAAGAEKLHGSLTHYLPEAIAKSGFVTVQPASRRYEVIFDFSKLLDSAEPKDFTLTGLKPLSVFAEPADNDQWKLESGGYLDLAASYKIADVLTTISYKIGSYSYNGLFDPEITNFRTADFTAKDIRLTSDAGTEKVNASFGAMTGQQTATDGLNGTIDFVSKGSMTEFREDIASAQTPPVQIGADSIDFDINMKGVMIRELRELVFFVLEHAKQDTLTPEQQTTIKQMVRKAMPLAASIDELVTFNNVTVGTPMGEFGVKNVQYGLKSTGLTDKTRIEIALNASDLKMPEGVLPPSYLPLIPDSAEFAFAMPEMDMATVINEFLNSFDISKPEPISPEESDRIGKLIFPGGKVSMEITRLAAKSAAYDVEMTGSFSGTGDNIMGTPEEQKKFAFDASILARDFDNTITRIQEAAKLDPQLNQVSFGLMMAKGFAKADPDGRQRWDIAVTDDGSVTINGQLIKGPDEQ